MDLPDALAAALSAGATDAQAAELLEQAHAYVRALEERLRAAESGRNGSNGAAVAVDAPPLPPGLPASPTRPRTGSQDRPRRPSEGGGTAPGSRRRVVLKIGTASLVNEHGLKIGQVATILDVVAELKRADLDVLLVCSGAVGTGSQVLSIRERPTSRPKIRALAAVGQARLIRELNHVLAAVGVESAQILLSFANLGEYEQSLNAQNTINELFAMNVVPIVNENDTTAVEHARFGDNDRLAAMVATVIDADFLFLLTDVNGVFTADPRRDPTATRIELITNVDEVRARIRTDTGAGTSFSTGGMDSKLVAAQISTRAGVRTVVMRAADVRGIPEYLAKQAVVADGASAGAGAPLAPAPAPFGTVFVEQRRKQHARKKWLQTLPPKGKILVDEGAAKAMRSRKTLFAAGVRAIVGKFATGDPVHVCAERAPDVVLAVGFPNYNHSELARIAGKRSEEITAILGAEFVANASEPGAVVDRENLAWATARS